MKCPSKLSQQGRAQPAYLLTRVMFVCGLDTPLSYNHNLDMRPWTLGSSCIYAVSVNEEMQDLLVLATRQDG